MKANLRRRRLKIGVAAILAGCPAQAQKSPATEEGSRLWNDFSREWNRFADSLNSGVFDKKGWERVRKAFHRLEER